MHPVLVKRVYRISLCLCCEPSGKPIFGLSVECIERQNINYSEGRILLSTLLSSGWSKYIWLSSHESSTLYYANFYLADGDLYAETCNPVS